MNNLVSNFLWGMAFIGLCGTNLVTSPRTQGVLLTFARGCVAIGISNRIRNHDDKAFVWTRTACAFALYVALPLFACLETTVHAATVVLVFWAAAQTIFGVAHVDSPPAYHDFSAVERNQFRLCLTVSVVMLQYPVVISHTTIQAAIALSVAWFGMGWAYFRAGDQSWFCRGCAAALSPMMVVSGVPIANWVAAAALLGLLGFSASHQHVMAVDPSVVV